MGQCSRNFECLKRLDPFVALSFAYADLKNSSLGALEDARECWHHACSAFLDGKHGFAAYLQQGDLTLKSSVVRKVLETWFFGNDGGTAALDLLVTNLYVARSCRAVP